MLTFGSEVRSGVDNMLPVVIALCVCVCVWMLAVCLPDEEESLDAPVSGAQGGPPCRTLMSDRNRPRK